MQRLAQLGGLAAGVAGDMTRSAVGKAEERFHLQAAERVVQALGDMKGLPLKLGQLLSYIDDALPEEHRETWLRVLAQLQAHTPAHPPEAMRALLESELGDLEARFESLDSEPFAAASIGQVYGARLHDGRRVAVKVQYPGIAEAMASDLDNVESLVAAMTTVLPRSDVHRFVEDVTARLQEELDYAFEGANQATFARLWAGDTQVRVPKVIAEHCTRRVLVSERVDGLGWAAALEAEEPLRQAWGRSIHRFVYGSLYSQGIFNADPHPGNYLFQPDGSVAFIDFGCVQRYDAVSTAAFRELRDRALSGALDGPDFRALLDRAFGLPPSLDEELWGLFEDYVRLTLVPLTAPQPYRFTRETTRALTRSAWQAKLVMSRKALRKGVQATEREGVIFMTRINFGLASVLAALGAEADWPAELRSSLPPGG